MIKSTLTLLNSASVLSLIYFILIALYSGIRTSFLWFWPVLAVCCGVASFLLRYTNLHRTAMPWRILTPTLLIGIWTVFLILFITECAILYTATKEPEENVEYMIVLGAQVRGDKPSLSLQARIDTAAEYLAAHPQVKVICSGGKGRGENKSEAAAIRDGLLLLGIDPARIQMEDTSTNTVENLRFCRELLPTPCPPVLIVTNDFHCKRAGLIAKNAATWTVPPFLLGNFCSQRRITSYGNFSRSSKIF